MSSFILPLADVTSDHLAEVGGKAATLGTLARAGFPVPPGLCLTTHAFRAALQPYQAQIGQILGQHQLGRPEAAHAAAGEIASLLADLTVPAATRDALANRITASFSEDAPLAVRSSATAEDRKEVSFAGQYETVLGVTGVEGVCEAILTCWRSFYSGNALAARAGAGLTDPEEAMALLIMPVIKAETAGVCFTMDAVRGQKETLVIEAAWGLGVGAVDGTAGTDTYWFDRRAIQPANRRIVEKTTQFQLNAEGKLVSEPVPDDRRKAACLPPLWVGRLSEMALAAEYLLGRAQDVEWAVADGKLWLLQSRPITTLPEEVATVPRIPLRWHEEAHSRQGWVCWNAHDAVKPPLVMEVKELFASCWVEAGHFAGREKVPSGRQFCGALYLSFMPNPSAEGDRRVRQNAMKDLAAHLWSTGVTAWEHWKPTVEAAVNRLAAFDFTEADDRKLSEHLEDCFGAYQRHWTLHWLYGATDMPYAEPLYAAFKALTGRSGDEAKREVAQLIDGDENELTRLIDALYELAQLAAVNPVLQEAAASPAPDTLDRIGQASGSEAFLARWEAFMGQYGERVGAGYGSNNDITDQTWRENPTPVFELMGPYLNPGAEAPKASRARAEAARHARIDQLCAACEDAAAVETFRRALPLARRSMTDLENHNHTIDQMSHGQLRRAVLVAGQRLAERGALESTDDIFFLKRVEIMQALRAKETPNLRSTVAERKAQYEQDQKLVHPPVIGVPDPDLPKRPPLKEELTRVNPEESHRISGFSASPGRRRGRARVVNHTERLPAVEPGDILVSENAGPRWTPIFPLLGGLVLDHGSVFQHAATTAREYGIPSVMNTGNATRRIADGAWIVIDGTEGIIELEADAEGRIA